MLSGVTNEDLRSIKTEKALRNAMFSLLETQNFRKITIKGICERSLISRAAFYAHFVDKYDLLKRWITETWNVNFARKNEVMPEDGGGGDGDNSSIFSRLESAFAAKAGRNLKILKNLITDADSETMEILFDFLLTTQDIVLQKGGEAHGENIVFANFYAGGILSYISWQIKNRFPPEVPIINKHFCEMINTLKGLLSGDKKD